MSERLAAAVRGVEPSATLAVSQAVRRMRAQGVGDIIGMDAGQPAWDTPAYIVEAAVRALRAGETRYGDAAGRPDLREAICGKLGTENGMRVTPDRVVVTPGAKYAIFLAFQALLGPGTRVMVLDPAWVTYAPAAQIVGADVLRIPCDEADGFQPDPDRIEAALDPSVRLVVLNSPCNPTGVVFEPDRIRRVAEIARAHNALVLSDEIYEYLLYEGEFISPGAEYDNVITVNGFSKAFAMTGWRLGYAAGPRFVINAMVTLSQHSTTCPTAFGQAGALCALTDPARAGAIGAMLERFGESRRALIAGLRASRHLSDAVPEGTFYGFPAYDVDAPSTDVALALLRIAHVATVPGAAFGARGEGHLRISFSGTVQEVAEGVERIDAFLEDHRDAGMIRRAAKTPA